MDLDDPVVWLLMSLLAGAAIYTAVALAYRQFHLERMLVAALGSVAVPSGIDLIVCAFNPAHLIRLVDKGGAPFAGAAVPVIGEMHRLDLAGGGLVLVAIGVSELVIELKRIKAAAKTAHA